MRWKRPFIQVVHLAPTIYWDSLHSPRFTPVELVHQQVCHQLTLVHPNCSMENPKVVYYCRMSATKSVHNERKSVHNLWTLCQLKEVGQSMVWLLVHVRTHNCECHPAHWNEGCASEVVKIPKQSRARYSSDGQVRVHPYMLTANTSCFKGARSAHIFQGQFCLVTLTMPR